MCDDLIIRNLKITEAILIQSDTLLENAWKQTHTSFERQNKLAEGIRLKEEILTMQHELTSIGFIRPFHQQIRLEDYYLPPIDLPESDIRFLITLFSVPQSLATLKQICWIEKISPLEVIGNVIDLADEVIFLMQEQKPFCLFSPLNMTLPPLYFNWLGEKPSSTFPFYLKISKGCLQNVLRQLYIDVKISPVSCRVERNQITDFQEYLASLNGEIVLQNLKNFHSFLASQIQSFDYFSFPPF